MSHVMSQPAAWYRVIIDNHRLATPAGCRALIELAITHVPTSVITIDRIEVVPSSSIENFAVPFKKLSVGSLFVAFESVTQLVWGRFFLFANSVDAERANGYGLAERIAASQMTICIVDNSSCFIFTKSASLVCEIIGSYLQLEIVKDELPRILARKEDF